MKISISIKQILTLLFIVISSSFIAQDIYVEISCTNSYPGVGEKIKLSYILKKKMKGGMVSISHNGIGISKPDMKSLNIIEEGTEGNSFSFGNMGGDMQISKYSFIIQPTKEGDVKIAPFTFKMNGESHTSESFTLHVGKGDPNAQIIKKNSNYFMTIDVSKKSIYPGEPALVTYTLFSRSSNISFQKSDFPMSDAFWSENIEPGNQGFGQTQVNLNGYAYLKIPVKKVIIFADEAGEFKLPPCTADLAVGGGFFSQGTIEKLESNSPVITVKPLPEGAPNSFRGQVGKDYELTVNYSTTQLKAGEAIDLTIDIAGKGNLNKQTAPNLNFPSDFDTYDPETEGKTKLSTSYGFVGNRTFKYLIIPRHHGTYEIPAFEFTYFDLASESYQTLSYPEQTIQVEKSATSTPSTINGSTVNKEDVEVLNEDIRHIAYSTSLSSAESTFYNSGLFWTSITLPFVLAIGGFIFLSFKPEEKVVDKKKTAGKHIFKTLKVAEQKLAENDNLGFYDELYKGLMHYLSNKLEMPFSDLTKESVVTRLNNKELSEGVLKIIEECEMAKYTPITSASAQETMNTTKNLIQQIEKNVS